MVMLLCRLLFMLLIAAPVVATPAMWQIGRGAKRITLYGTVHALPPGKIWMSAAAQRAFADADTLVVEAADTADAAAVAAVVQRVGILPAAVPIASRLPTDLQTQVAETMQRLGLAEGRLDHLKSWLAAISILGADMARSGLDPADGVDRALIAMAQAAAKPVIGLETAEYQLGLFDALPEAEQRLLLGSAVSDAASAQDEVRGLLEAWEAGDMERIRADFDDGKLSPELEAALLTRRNTAWSNWLAQRVKRREKLFVAVGAAHMAGPNGLIALLRARGIRIKRIE